MPDPATHKAVLQLACGHNAIGKTSSERKRCILCQSMQEVVGHQRVNDEP